MKYVIILLNNLFPIKVPNLHEALVTNNDDYINQIGEVPQQIDFSDS